MSILPGFSQKPAPTPELPEIPEPAVMPDPDDKGMKATKRRKASARSRTRGRVSTFNTGTMGSALG